MTSLEFKELFNTLKALPAVQTFRNEVEMESYKIVHYQEEDYLISIFDPNNRPYNEDKIHIGYISKEKKTYDKVQIPLNQEDVFTIHSENKEAFILKFNNDFISTNAYIHGKFIEKEKFKIITNKKLLKEKIAKLV